MDPQRDDENQYPGAKPRPKITLVGCLEGTVDGRPVRIVAANGNLTVDLQFISLLAMRRSRHGIPPSVDALLRFAHLRLCIRVGWLGFVEVSPYPSVLTRHVAITEVSEYETVLSYDGQNTLKRWLQGPVWMLSAAKLYQKYVNNKRLQNRHDLWPSGTAL